MSIDPHALAFAADRRTRCRASWGAVAAMIGVCEADLRAALDPAAGGAPLDPEQTLRDEIRAKLEASCGGRASALMEIVEGLMAGQETVAELASGLRLGRRTIGNRLRELRALRIVGRRGQVRDNELIWHVIGQEARR